MVTKNTYKNLIWIDVESPTRADVRELMKEHDIHPYVGEELLSRSQRPHIDVYDEYFYLVLHFPAIRHTDSNEKNHEVDFIIGKNKVITVRYDRIGSLDKFKAELEMDDILDKAIAAKHAGFMFYYMFLSLYRSLDDELEYIEGALQTIEDEIFKGREREMVEDLSRVSHDIIDIKQTIQHQEQILPQLEDVGKKFFGTVFARKLADVKKQYNHVTHEVQNLQELLAELRVTNDSLLSAKQNEVRKILTILAFITFPLSLVAGIFGMNTKSLPIVGVTGDFWIILVLMLVLTGAFFAFFKYKKWL